MNKHLLFPFNFKLSFLEYWDTSIISVHLEKVITTDKLSKLGNWNFDVLKTIPFWVPFLTAQRNTSSFREIRSSPLRVLTAILIHLIEPENILFLTEAISSGNYFPDHLTILRLCCDLDSTFRYFLPCFAIYGECVLFSQCIKNGGSLQKVSLFHINSHSEPFLSLRENWVEGMSDIFITNQWLRRKRKFAVHWGIPFKYICVCVCMYIYIDKIIFH